VGHRESSHQPAGGLTLPIRPKGEIEVPSTVSNRASTTALPVAAIVAVSVLALGFLCWLLYVHRASGAFATRLNFLPSLEALLNGLCTVALLTGFYFIRRRNIVAHRRSMIAAFIFSLLFLVSYILHHALHGDARFPGHGTVRTVYLSILISHITLSAVALPMVLTTFFFALSGRFAKHRALARYTLPIWLYVSVTGVVVYAMLAAWR
jgi:putative membrane protein